MLHIPILRNGLTYESLEKVEIVHHVTGEPVAQISQANSGMIVHDVHRMDDTILEQFSVEQLLDMCRKAAELFISAELAIGDQKQSFDDYLRILSSTTGMPITYCKNNAEKIRHVLADMDTILAGLTRGFDMSILDKGHGRHNGHTISFFRDGRVFGAVLPSNSPGVHGIWIPAIALKAPIVLKPGREEPWTPYRIIEALAAAGIPREAMSFYPTDHAGAGELLRVVDRAMLFGDATTTRPWKNDPRIEIHGPGYSKILLDDQSADDWEQHLNLIETSIAANGGRSCINVSSVWTPKNGRAIADALAKNLSKVQAHPADHPDASIAAFANPLFAERISAIIDNDLLTEGATDVTESFRGSSRLVKQGRCSYLLPTIIHCENRDHPLANREFLFPCASVVECSVDEMTEAIGQSLVVTAITNNQKFIQSLMVSSNVDRLNVGAIPTYQLSWDQPHEGNLFEHLYRQRAFQNESAA